MIVLYFLLNFLSDLTNLFILLSILKSIRGSKHFPVTNEIPYVVCHI